MCIRDRAFYPTAYIARLMRSSMLDVLGQDYMRTARAKGLSQSKSLFKHALRNAVLPVVTYVGPMVAYTMTGSFVVEKIFTIPGLGGEFVGSILNRDYTIIMGTTDVYKRQGVHEVPDASIVKPLKTVTRMADAVDVRRMEKNRADEKHAFEVCTERIQKHGLDMKLVDVEYTLDPVSYTHLDVYKRQG